MPFNPHEDGAIRHGAAWLSANQRAVQALTGTKLKPWNAEVKAAIPYLILRVLDGVRLDGGEWWDGKAKEWTRRER